jgi:K+/H+ antiporter YhaU regulatory subunit KhtT
VPEDVVHRLTLAADSPAVGETTVTLNIRAKTGASVVSVIRDGKVTRNIGADWEFRIGDTLVVLGNGAEVAALKDLLGVIA